MGHPAAPVAVIDAIRQVIARPKVTGRQITVVVGPPDFMTGCAVTGRPGRRPRGGPAAARQDHDQRRHAPAREYRIACVPEPGTPPEELRRQLEQIEGVTTRIPAALPRPLAAMIRGWVRGYQDEDLLASLTARQNAIASGQPYHDV